MSALYSSRGYRGSFAVNAGSTESAQLTWSGQFSDPVLESEYKTTTFESRNAGFTRIAFFGGLILVLANFHQFTNAPGLIFTSLGILLFLTSLVCNRPWFVDAFWRRYHVFVVCGWLTLFLCNAILVTTLHFARGYDRFNLGECTEGSTKEDDFALESYRSFILPSLLIPFVAVHPSWFFQVSVSGILTFHRYVVYFFDRPVAGVFDAYTLAIFCFFSVAASHQETMNRKAFFLTRRLSKDNITVKLSRDSPLTAINNWMRTGASKDKAQAVDGSGHSWLVNPEHIEWGDTVGRGAFGEVVKATWRGTPVAVKILRASAAGGASAGQEADFAAEIGLLAGLRHPHIVLFMGVCLEPHRMLLLTEFLDAGSLASIIYEAKRPLELAQIVRIGLQTARGMTYLHSNDPPILHKDLKPDNLLLDSNLSVKIADFGLSSVSGDGNIGTMNYMAPEALSGDEFVAASDVYSYGILLNEIMVRKEPYMDLIKGSMAAVVIKIAMDDLRPDMAPECPPGLCALISKAWAPLPADRPTFAEIQQILREYEATMMRVSDIDAPTPPPAPFPGLPGSMTTDTDAAVAEG